VQCRIADISCTIAEVSVHGKMGSAGSWLVSQLLRRRNGVDFRPTPTRLEILYITFFNRGPAGPSQQRKRASNSIQDPPPRWILTIFKLRVGGGNLFSPAMTCTIKGNNSVGSLLEPLLKKVTPVVGSRMLMLCILQAVQVFFFFFRAECLDSFSNLVLIPKKDSFLSPRLKSSDGPVV
jgi:hypothetical protein